MAVFGQKRLMTDVAEHPLPEIRLAALNQRVDTFASRMFALIATHAITESE